MNKITTQSAYQNLAGSVLQAAFDDLPRRMLKTFSGGYQEVNHQNRAAGVQFFETGRFVMWADMSDFAHDVLMKLYKEKVEQVEFRDNTGGKVNGDRIVDRQSYL